MFQFIEAQRPLTFYNKYLILYININNEICYFHFSLEVEGPRTNKERINIQCQWLCQDCCKTHLGRVGLVSNKRYSSTPISDTFCENNVLRKQG